ncbi:YcfL family protein [Rosenbergiella australiborealis]|uniref:DUF1425 domain-containing protein n=1 Tax=Rosenbergiella australiborealis TaxID=1544696 RepID=A0ABS5T2P5_9GAMM|nr:DUF1425 domain-containing protein [Rosenbergiella australiborealis]MBT0726606.1 DUF1425 domain-containing protein [Rosenbergiella australiborealis]
MRVLCMALLVAIGTVSCSSKPAAITISQPLVMGPEVLSAGIIADAPVMNDEQAPAATTRVYNDRDVPLTIHYRYFWYDQQGLAIPYSPRTQSIAIPAHSSSELLSSSGSVNARQVRIYISL